MPLDLTSVRAKLSRAQEHAQTIKNEIISRHDRHPYSILEKIEPDGSRYALIMRVNEPGPVQRWTLIVADALNNMRSALDNFVYAVACYESAPNPPRYEGTLAFPMLRLVYGAVNEGDVGLIGNRAMPNVTATAHHGEIEDGTEIVTFTCDPPTPNMKFDQTIISITISMFHGKRDPSDPDGTDRSDVPSLLSVLHKEVRSVIYEITSKMA